MAVIFLLLLLFLGGLGTVNHINFLLEAETITPWIVTTACGIIVCIVVFINRFREESKIMPVLLVIGGVGIVQLIVYGNIDIPSYMKGDDGWSTLAFTALISQIPYLLIGYAISWYLQKVLNRKFNVAVDTLKMVLDNQSVAVDWMLQIIGGNNRSDWLAEKVVDLFRLIDGDELRDAYVVVQNAKNANVIQKVREISPKAEVTIYDNQALSDIVKSVVERRNEIKNEIEELINLRISYHNLLFIKKTLKNYNSEF